jgi:hypothetical protein
VDSIYRHQDVSGIQSGTSQHYTEVANDTSGVLNRAEQRWKRGKRPKRTVISSFDDVASMNQDAPLGTTVSTSSVYLESQAGVDDDKWEDAEAKIIEPKLLSGEDGGGDDDWVLPEDEQALDVEALISMPSQLRKELVGAARRKQRMKTRADYMPVGMLHVIGYCGSTPQTGRRGSVPVLESTNSKFSQDQPTQQTDLRRTGAT